MPILRWCLLGALGRVLSWPLGFVMLAKGKGRLYFVSGLLAASFHVAAVYGFSLIYGLEGAGIAFMSLYVFYTALTLLIAHRLIEATWQSDIVKLIALAVAVLGGLMYVENFELDSIIYWCFKSLILIVLSIYSIRQLLNKSGMGWQDVFARLGIK